MDTHYIVPNEDVLTQAMEQYTHWHDDQIISIFENVDHPVDQEGVGKTTADDKLKNDKVLSDKVFANTDESGNKEGSLYKGLKIMVPPAGIEPAAHGLGIHCSIH